MGLYTLSGCNINLLWILPLRNHLKPSESVFFFFLSAGGFTYMLHACKHRPFPSHPNKIQLIMIHSSVVSFRLQVDKLSYMILFSSLKYYHAECYLFKAPKGLCSTSPDRDLHTRSIICAPSPLIACILIKHSYRFSEHACLGTR